MLGQKTTQSQPPERHPDSGLSCFTIRAADSARARREIALPDGAAGWITVHPSYLLRIPDEAKAKDEYARFVDDLKGAAALVG